MMTRGDIWNLIERDVEARLGAATVICARCGCTFASWGELCDFGEAPAEDADCPGVIRMLAVYEATERLYLPREPRRRCR
jgi:hypothetical protein